MFRFFRQIRHRLFQEGKASRYLGYAIGEIVLIVVGILIAVQIGDWNEESNDRDTEQQILIGLRSEFSEQLINLRRRLETTENHYERIETFMHYLTQEESEYRVDQLDEALRAIMSPNTWDPANDVLEALVSSGRLELIRDTELRVKLARWESVAEEVKDNFEMMRNYQVNTLWPLFGKKGVPILRVWGKSAKTLTELLTETSGRLRYKNLKGDQELVDMISVKYATIGLSIKEIEIAIHEAEEIASAIERNIQ